MASHKPPAGCSCPKEGRPWPGPVGVLDLQLPTGAWLRGVFWCAGKPACWAFDRTIKRCPGRSQRQPASSDTLGKRSRSWRAILPKYLSPRTTRLRALPPLPPGRPCPWPPSAPLNSMQAGLPEKFGGLTPRPGVWPRGRTASTSALLLQGDARDKTWHASSSCTEECAAAISVPESREVPTPHATRPARSSEVLQASRAAPRRSAARAIRGDGEPSHDEGFGTSAWS